MCVLLVSLDLGSQLIDAVISYGLDQLDCCHGCGPEYSMSVLTLLTLVRINSLIPLTVSSGLSVNVIVFVSHELQRSMFYS